jgi:hypothetical protein
MPVYGIVVGFVLVRPRLQMRNDLMAEKIEIDPLRGAATLCAA